MKRLTLILASALLTLVAWARNDWYDDPIVIEPGKIALDTIPPLADDVMVHIRVASEDKHKASWSLIWGRTDTDDCIVANVSMPERKGQDDLYPSIVYVDVFQRVKGVDTPITSTNFSIEAEFFSLKFIFDGFSARLFAGDKDKKLLTDLPIDLTKPTTVQLASESTLKARRISVMYNMGNTPARADCPDADVLAKVMDGATGIEGTWVYLDRDIDTKKASLGHKYRLAIVKSDENTFQIVSIEPNSASKGIIIPLQVKGWLRSTNFSNNYDMVWYDINGRELDDDNNAQLSDDGNILTLRFPVYKSQLRFRRH